MIAKVNFDGNWLPDIDLLVHRFTLRERIHAGFRKFIIFFCAAILSIFIPVLHFVLVPLFLVLSLILGVKEFKEVLSVELMDTCCPGCNADLNVRTVSLKVSDPVIRLTCQFCRKSLTIMIENTTQPL